MILSFDTKELRDLCESMLLAKQCYGTVFCEFLMARLSDIEAADNYTDILAGNPRVSIVNEVESLCVSVADDYILVLIPNHNKPRVNPDGTTAWKSVTRLKLVAITNE